MKTTHQVKADPRERNHKKHPNTPVETTEFSAFVVRIMNAYARRVADADEVDLREMIEISLEWELHIALAARGMHARGMTWAYIGKAAGITPQAAFDRWSLNGRTAMKRPRKTTRKTLPASGSAPE